MSKSSFRPNASPELQYSITKTGSRSNWDFLLSTPKPVSKALSTMRLELTLSATLITRRILKESQPKRAKFSSKASLPLISYFPNKSPFCSKLPSGTTPLFTLLNPALLKSTNSSKNTSKTKLIVGDKQSGQKGDYLIPKNPELITRIRTIWLVPLIFCGTGKISTSKSVFTVSFLQMKAKILKKESFRPFWIHKRKSSHTLKEYKQ